MCELLSVVILTKNDEKQIGRCLKYLREQTYQEFEIVIVDANSSDSTVQIAKNYGSKVISEEEGKGGFGYARNLGVKHSNGTCITFLSADVMLTDPRTLEKTIRLLENEHIGGVWGKVIYPSTPLGYRFNKAFDDKRRCTTEWGLQPPRTTCFFTLKKSIFREVGLFDAHFEEGVEDQDFFYRAYQHGKIFLYEPTVRVFHATDLQTERQARKAYKEGRGLHKFFKKHGISSWIFSALYPVLAFGRALFLSMLSIRKFGLRGGSLFQKSLQIDIRRIKGFWEDESLEDG